MNSLYVCLLIAASPSLVSAAPQGSLNSFGASILKSRAIGERFPSKSLLESRQNVAQQWGQCGGMTPTGMYTGPTTCTSGNTCYCKDSTYSQCRPSDPGWTGCSGSTGTQPQTQPQTQGTLQQGALCGGTSYTSSTPGQCASGLICLCSDRSKSFCQPSNWRPGSDCGSSGSSGGAPPVGNFLGSSPSPVPSPSPGGSTGGIQSNEASTSIYWDNKAASCGCHAPGNKDLMASWQPFPLPGWYSGAVSANLFGTTASNQFCGTTCGKCFRLTTTGYVPPGQGNTPTAGVSINVFVVNLCPADQSPQWCSQPTNQFGYANHFDILTENFIMGMSNPVVTFAPQDCPPQLVSLKNSCQCVDGVDTHR